MVKPFIPKESAGLPDSYKMKVFYVTGKVEEFELAGHTIRDKVWLPTNDQRGGQFAPSAAPFFEYTTKEDVWGWIPMSSAQRIEFDQNFSKMMAERERRVKEEQETQRKMGEIKKAQ